MPYLRALEEGGYREERQHQAWLHPFSTERVVKIGKKARDMKEGEPIVGCPKHPSQIMGDSSSDVFT
jgi:hypothetical protein